jgi:hypothetical protein
MASISSTSFRPHHQPSPCGPLLAEHSSSGRPHCRLFVRVLACEEERLAIRAFLVWDSYKVSFAFTCPSSVSSADRLSLFFRPYIAYFVRASWQPLTTSLMVKMVVLESAILLGWEVGKAVLEIYMVQVRTMHFSVPRLICSAEINRLVILSTAHAHL